MIIKETLKMTERVRYELTGVSIVQIPNTTKMSPAIKIRNQWLIEFLTVL